MCKNIFIQANTKKINFTELNYHFPFKNGGLSIIIVIQERFTWAFGAKPSKKYDNDLRIFLLLFGESYGFMCGAIKMWRPTIMLHFWHLCNIYVQTANAHLHECLFEMNEFKIIKLCGAVTFFIFGWWWCYVGNIIFFVLRPYSYLAGTRERRAWRN